MTQTYIIDFDSTLITMESLDELARIALAQRGDAAEVMAKLEDITQKGMLGEIGFDESLRLRLSLFSPDREHVKQAVELFKTNISPSALAHIDWFQENAEHIYIVSGGFEDYILPIATELGLREDHIFANRFTYDESGEITGFDESNLLSQRQGKVAQIKSLGFDEPIIMIGDGYTDYETREHDAVNEFWAFTETVNRPKIAGLADKVINDFAQVV
ncbi:MAG: HAD-IB family phosphatase [Patescibacteria group bacterium]